MFKFFCILFCCLTFFHTKGWCFAEPPILWLDATDTGQTVSDGGSIITWNDLSGNNNHFTSTAGAGSYPIYRTSVFNGNSVLQTTDGNRHFENTSLDVTAGYFTSIIVAKRNSGNAQLWVQKQNGFSKRRHDAYSNNLEITLAEYQGTEWYLYQNR